MYCVSIENICHCKFVLFQNNLAEVKYLRKALMRDDVILAVRYTELFSRNCEHFVRNLRVKLNNPSRTILHFFHFKESAEIGVH